MADARWDVPQTEEGLQTLLSRLAESRAAGDEAAVGRGLLALAWLVKWVRSDNDEPTFVRAGTLATEAIEIFRRIGDERGLMAALRSPSTFLEPEETDRRLDEAMGIAERLGDERAVAETLAARSRAIGMRDREGASELNRRALAMFRALDDKAGQAGCLFGLSVQQDNPEEKYHAAAEAARLYREVGNLNMAGKSARVAVMYGESFLDFRAMEPLIRQALADAQAIGDRSSEGTFYGHLAKVAAAKGDHEEASKFLRWQSELSESDGLTPKERRQNDIEMTKQLIAMSKASSNAESVAMFEAELKRLQKTRVK